MMTEQQAKNAFPAAFEKARGKMHPNHFGGAFHLHMAHVMRALVDDPNVDAAIKAIAWRSIRAHIEVESFPLHTRGRPFINLFSAA